MSHIADRDLWTSRQPSDIKIELLRNLPPVLAGQSRVVTASMGHILLTSQPTQRSTIVPPLQGYWQLSKVLKWLHSHSVKRFFHPTLPFPLLDSTPARQRLLHRLVYHGIYTAGDINLAQPPTKVIHLEMLLAGPDFFSGVPSFSTAAGMDAMVNKSYEHDVTIHTGSQPSAEETSKAVEDCSSCVGKLLGADGPSTLRPISTVIPDTASIKCWIGSETTLDLMTPDRPMDVRFTALDSKALSQDEWPSELRNYAAELRSFLSCADEEAAQPDTPLAISYGGMDYILHSSSNLRQNIESISTPGLDSPVEAISESLLDLESDHKSTVCQVSCVDVTSEDSWRTFLSACDRLSAVAPPQSRRIMHDVDANVFTDGA